MRYTVGMFRDAFHTFIRAATESSIDAVGAMHIRASGAQNRERKCHMTKLMEQVRAIQARAHVCPVCEGTGIFSYQYCWTCKATGQVPAPDIDALVGAIEVLVAAVEEAEEELLWKREKEGGPSE